jgi:Secretion system C-terminal sorting domain
MKKLLLLSSISISVLIFSSSFKFEKPKNTHHFRTGGAAVNFDDGYLGAPFAAGSCSNCHGGGTFSPSINVQLLNLAGNVVTTYIPGTSYNLRISIVPTSGTPMYGFQTTCVDAATESNINNWGAAMPANVNNIAVSGGRNYVEQNAKLASGIITIPWTAPAASFGAVKFYSMGNAVNSNGSTSGDNATNSFVLTINESTLPIQLLSFDARENENENEIKLNWETAQESNSAFFNIERSIDGSSFTTIGKIIAKGNSNSKSGYSFSDKYFQNGINYYRLAQYDLDGRFEYSPVVKVQTGRSKIIVEVSPNPVIDKVFLKTSIKLTGAKYLIFNNSGVQVLSGILVSYEIDVQKLAKGNYFVKIVQNNNEIITTQFVK